MSKTTARVATGPHNVCLVRDCESATVGGERLCAIHYYRLPRPTRQALALEDERAGDRDHRLVAFVQGGVPLDMINII